MSLDRDKLQKEVADSFCALPNKKALAVLSTGTGKALIALLIIKQLNPEHILILVEGTVNRDKTFREEFIKWEMSEYLDRTEFYTYQLAHRWKKEYKDLTGYLVIADECDFAFTTKYGMFFKEYNDIPTFAMTGYVTPEKYEEYKKYLPILVNIPASEMQEKEVLNKTELVFVQFLLSSEKTRKIEYKKDGETKSFLQSENEAYQYFLKQERAANVKLLKAMEENNATDITKHTKTINVFIPRIRAAFLHTLDSSIEVAEVLIKAIMTNSDSKVITFSERTAHADLLSDNPYHGSMDEEEAQANFDKFNSGEIRILSTCSKVNRAVNIEKLNYAIMESYTGSKTQSTQRNGRLMRLPVEAVGTVYILMPYYLKDGEAYPTRAVAWAREIFNGLKGLKTEVFNHCGIDKIHR